jgi:hypothetical protein
VPKSVLTRKRSWIARFAVLAMVFSLMAVALPASAHSVAIDTSTPCPAATPSAGFTDIGGFDATTQLAINCLFAFGITTGTSATTYSPNDTTTRWQMALFLVRQAADHGLTIPTAVPQGYTDILTLPQSTQDAINQITQLGISKGTSTTTFSPFDGVSRWQMALFIYRLGVAAGVTFTNDSTHNEFTDIGGTLAEAQTAINALADAHVALGTGGSAFSPNLLLVRWQMALFLTRLLAADGIAAPAGLRVTVTPTAAATQAAASARAYTATFKNVDGTPYTGAVGLTLRSVVSSVVQYDNDPAPNAVIESVSSFATNSAVPSTTVTGFPGVDGVVNFVVRHVGAGQTIVPIAWEDLDGDGLPEITGNAAPTEPHGLGGNTTFSTAPLPECFPTGTPTAFGPTGVILVDKAADRFEIAGCSIFYDTNDLLLIEGAAATLDQFEAALTVGDSVTGTYDSDSADQSVIDIDTDNVAAVTVTSPSAATTTSSGTFTVTGTGAVGYIVAIYTDNDNLTTINGADAKVGEGTVAADGTWSINVPLQTGVDNNFTANQRAASGDPNGTPVDVPTITQTSGAGVTLNSTTSAGAPADGILAPSDTIVIVFSAGITGVGSGDTIAVVDPDGTTATITNGTNATFTVGTTVVANDTLTVLITAVLPVSGGSGGIDDVATITAVGGFTGANGVAVNVAGSADRTFSPF